MRRHLCLISIYWLALGPVQAGSTDVGAAGIDCKATTNQTEMTACASDAAARADKALNTAYKAAIAAMKKQDAAAIEGTPNAVVILRDAQRAWITFRDNACSVEAAARGGTGASMAFLQCKERLTNRRRDDLRILFKTP